VLAGSLVVFGASFAALYFIKGRSSSLVAAKIAESGFKECELPANVCAVDLGLPQINLGVKYSSRIHQNNGQELSFRLSPLKGASVTAYKSVVVNLGADSGWSFVPGKHLDIPVSQKRPSIILASCSITGHSQKVLVNAELIPRNTALQPRPLANAMVLDIEVLPAAVMLGLTERKLKAIEITSAALGLPALLLSLLGAVGSRVERRRQIQQQERFDREERITRISRP